VLNQSHISDKMTADKSSDKDILCKFQNSGFCKYRGGCRFKHVSEQCEGKCDKKVCRKRHQKSCRFGSKCRRQNICEYKHQANAEEQSLKAQIIVLEATNAKLEEENKIKKAEMDRIELELKASLNKLIKENNVKDTLISELKERLKKEVIIKQELENKIIKMEKKERVQPKESETKMSVKKAEQVKKSPKSKTPFSCKLCTGKFSKKSNLQDHIRNNHLRSILERASICSLCGKEVSRKSTIKKHIQNNHIRSVD